MKTFLSDELEKSLLYLSEEDLIELTQLARLFEKVSYSTLVKTLLRMKDDPNSYSDQDISRLVPDGLVVDDVTKKLIPTPLLIKLLANNEDLHRAKLILIDPTTKRVKWNLPPKAFQLLKFIVTQADPDVWEKTISKYPSASIGELLSLAYNV